VYGGGREQVRVWVLQQVQERKGDDDAAAEHFADALMRKIEFLMELTPALHEHKSEAGLLLLLNDHAPPTPATSAAPTPAAAAGAAAATGGAAASGATRAGQLASFRFQTSIALPTAQPSPPLSRKPQPQPQEQRQEAEGQDGESVSGAAGGGEGRPRGGARRRGLMGRLNSSGDGFSYPRRQAGKRKRGAAPAGSSGSSSSSTASAASGSTSSSQDVEAAEQRPRPFLQSLLLSRSTSVDSLGSMRTPTTTTDSAISLTLSRVLCVVCRVSCRAATRAEWAQERQSKEKAEKTLQAIYYKWKAFREKIILPSAKASLSSSSSSALSAADSPLAPLDKQVANFLQDDAVDVDALRQCLQQRQVRYGSIFLFLIILILISLINVCRARGRERALRLVCSMLDSPPGEGEPSEHREMALHHLYRALWCHPAAPAPASSVVVVHHRNVLVRIRRSHPTPILGGGADLVCFFNIYAQGAGQSLLGAIDAQMERLSVRLVGLITRHAASPYAAVLTATHTTHTTHHLGSSSPTQKRACRVRACVRATRRSTLDAHSLPLLLLALCYAGRLFDGWGAPMARLLPSALAALESLRVHPSDRPALPPAPSLRTVRAVACRTLRLLIGQASELEPPSPADNPEQAGLLLGLVRFAFDALTRALQAYLSWIHLNALSSSPSSASSSSTAASVTRPWVSYLFFPQLI
jgi:hypothetical protein